MYTYETVCGLGWFFFVLCVVCFFFLTNSVKSPSVVRIQLKKMCHLADESTTLKAGFSEKPASKIDDEGFHIFFISISRSSLLHIRNRGFLNARPENLFWALTVSLSYCCFSPSFFLCHYLPKDNDAVTGQQPLDVIRLYQAARSVGKTEHGQKNHGMRNTYPTRCSWEMLG